MSASINWLGNCTFFDSVVCAGHSLLAKGTEKLIGACTGDSGAPLMCEAADGRFYAMGLLAFGPKLCGKSHDYFTDVTKYTDWINSTIAGFEE